MFFSPYFQCIIQLLVHAKCQLRSKKAHTKLQVFCPNAQKKPVLGFRLFFLHVMTSPQNRFAYYFLNGLSPTPQTGYLPCKMPFLINHLTPSRERELKLGVSDSKFCFNSKQCKCNTTELKDND